MVGVSDVVTIATSQYNWVLLFLWLLYQIYWPEELHPSKPKLRRIFADDPRIRTITVAISDIAELTPRIDDESLKADLNLNGETYITDAVSDGGYRDDEE